MSESKTIKCVVWDLDNTIWNGVLLEDAEVIPRPEVVAAIETLDSRGILHSIASRNDHELAMQKLRELGLAEYFLAPQISWGAKSASVASIAKLLNIGIDTLAFVDDDAFERAEVEAAHPEVLGIDAVEAASLVDMERLQPAFVTADTRARRSMYQAEFKREEIARDMAPEEFLASLDMVFTISEAEEDDLARVEELTIRTNQLNSTGLTFSHDELRALRTSPDHLLLVAGLEDRFGTYGKIGIALVDQSGDVWKIELLLMSCRVMARGVGKVLLTHILREAERVGVPVEAEFVRTPHNRPMYLTFKFAGFTEVNREGDHAVVRHDLSVIDPVPSYVELRAP